MEETKTQESPDVILAGLIMKEWQNKNYPHGLTVPIDEIDGVRVDCYFEISEKAVDFHIRGDFRFVNKDDGEPVRLFIKRMMFHNGKILDFTKSVLDLIPKLRFVDDYFVLGDDSVGRKDKLRNVFKTTQCATIKLTPITECVVCYTDTPCRTCCGHSLCYRCWSHIPHIVMSDEYDLSKIPCPVCRENIRNS